MTIAEIKEAIVHLKEKEFDSFASWFEHYEEERWDKELQNDSKSGRLDFLVKEAETHYNSGNCTEL